MEQLEVTVYGKPGCHLCEVASEVVQTVAAEFPEDAVTITEIDILGDQQLVERYGEKIPVVFLGEELHAFWRVDPGRLRKAIASRVRQA